MSKSIAHAALLRVPRKVVRVELGGDYAGGWAELVLNPPSAVADTLYAAFRHAGEGEPVDGDAVRTALARLLVAWNLADADGRQLPATAAGLGELDWEGIGALFVAWGEARALPLASGGGSTPGTAAGTATRQNGSLSPNGRGGSA